MAHKGNHICLHRFSFIYAVNDLWEDAYTCPIYAVNRTTESANLRYGMSAYIGFCCSYSGLTDFIDTIPRLLYTKPTSKSQTNNSYDYETFVIVIILTTFLSADPKPDIWLRIWSQNSLPVRQEIPFWWTIQCMKILILITVSTVAFLWQNLLCALKNTIHSIIIKGEYDWTQTMKNPMASCIWCGIADWTWRRNKVFRIWFWTSAVEETNADRCVSQKWKTCKNPEEYREDFPTVQYCRIQIAGRWP